MERYDIAVIGTGPAGLSAAVTATIRNKKVLLLGSKELSAKLERAHEIQNYLGFPAVKGEDLAAAFQKHLNQMGISITEKRINAVYSMGDYFALQSGEEMLEASAVILATGVVQEAEAAFLSEVCREVLYFPMYKEETNLPGSVRVIREKVSGVENQDGRRIVRTAENSYTVDGVFILREAVSPGQLVPGLPTEGPHVIVNRSMEAGIPGVFACGDLVGTPYQYIKAAGEGNIAALSAVSYLDQKKRLN